MIFAFIFIYMKLVLQRIKIEICFTLTGLMETV